MHPPLEVDAFPLDIKHQYDLTIECGEGDEVSRKYGIFTERPMPFWVNSCDSRKHSFNHQFFTQFVDPYIDLGIFGDHQQRRFCGEHDTIPGQDRWFSWRICLATVLWWRWTSHEVDGKTVLIQDPLMFGRSFWIPSMYTLVVDYIHLVLNRRLKNGARSLVFYFRDAGWIYHISFQVGVEHWNMDPELLPQFIIYVIFGILDCRWLQ